MAELHQFRDLPPEVRIMIWKLAAERQRGIYTVPGPITPPIPAMAQVCRESRAVFDESWVSKEARASTDRLISVSRASSSWKYFDPEYDSVLVSVHSLHDQRFPLYGLNDVRSVVVTADGLWPEDWKHHILPLFSLQRVSLVAGEVVLSQECWEIVAEYMCYAGPSLVVDLDNTDDIDYVMDLLKGFKHAEKIVRNIARLRQKEWRHTDLRYSWQDFKAGFVKLARESYRKDVELRRVVLFT
jgi:hypothetical protein